MPELVQKLVQSKVYDLEQPRFAGMPAFAAATPAYTYSLHRRHADAYDPAQHGPRSGATGTIAASDHFGTHIDALCHQAEEMTLFGGVEVRPGVETPAGFTRLGAESIPPIVAEGTLLDVARHRGVELLPAGYAITPEDLAACAEAYGTEIRPGGVILVRTGNGRLWHEPAKYMNGVGLSPDANRWILGYRPLAVGADNLTWDAPAARDAETGASMAGHLLLLVRAGIYILENLNLEELAADRLSHFLFVATPLKLTGATGAPVRPVVISVE